MFPNPLTTMVRYWPLMRALLVVGGILTVLISVVRWGGTARPGPLFVAGVALLSGLLLVFGLIIAWMFTGPRPASDSRAAASIETRHTVSILALISTTSFVIGGAWDELWHRRFGGFGNDFLWPPHLLIYGSIALFLVFAGNGLWVTLRRPGSLRERLRREGQMSMLSLMCAFLIMALPLDELWHRIYGKDLTAWSLPHIIVGGGVASIALVSAGLALSSIPRHEQWRDVRRLYRPELLALLLITTATIITNQLATAEWEGIKQLSSEGGVFRDAFWQRPQWLYPVVVITVSLFFCTFALHLLRCAGVATIIALLVFGFRLGVLATLNSENSQLAMRFTSQLLPVFPAIALDAWYFFRKDSADRLLTLVGGNLVAVVVFLALGLPVIQQTLVYPPVNTFTVPDMISMSVVMGLASGWAGSRFGGWLGAFERPDTLVPIPQRVVVFTVAGCSVVLLVTLSIMLTAQVPVSVGLGLSEILHTS